MHEFRGHSSVCFTPRLARAGVIALVFGPGDPNRASSWRKSAARQ